MVFAVVVSIQVLVSSWCLLLLCRGVGVVGGLTGGLGQHEGQVVGPSQKMGTAHVLFFTTSKPPIHNTHQHPRPRNSTYTPNRI